MTGPQLVIFGCLTTDNVVTSEGEFLPQTFGGNCLYAALGARVWSNSVGVVSRYGAGYSEAPLDLLRGLGVDTSGVRNLGVPHGRNVAFAYRADGSRTRAFPPDLIARIPVEERGRFIDSSLLPDADERWRQFAPDGEDAPPEWWDGVVGVHCAYMPVSNHMRIAQMVRRKSASSDFPAPLRGMRTRSAALIARIAASVSCAGSPQPMPIRESVSMIQAKGGRNL